MGSGGDNEAVFGILLGESIEVFRPREPNPQSNKQNLQGNPSQNFVQKD